MDAPSVGEAYLSIPATVSSVCNISGNIITRIDASEVCSGNRDLRFSALTQKNNGKFRNPEGKQLFSVAIVKFSTVIMIIGAEVVAAADVALDLACGSLKC